MLLESVERGSVVNQSHGTRVRHGGWLCIGLAGRGVLTVALYFFKQTRINGMMASPDPA
jgi:hypothetical protein